MLPQGNDLHSFHNYFSWWTKIQRMNIVYFSLAKRKQRQKLQRNRKNFLTSFYVILEPNTFRHLISVILSFKEVLRLYNLVYLISFNIFVVVRCTDFALIYIQTHIHIRVSLSFVLLHCFLPIKDGYCSSKDQPSQPSDYFLKLFKIK